MASNDKRINSPESEASRLRASCSPSPSTASEKNVSKRMQEAKFELVNFEPKLASLCRENGVAEALERLADTKHKFSEGDPLLLMVVDYHDPASIAYADNGLFALPLGHVAAVNWALWPGGQPAGAMNSPGALGNFIASIPGVSERSGGKNCVFHVADLEVLDDVRQQACAQHQFCIYGPVHAPQLNVPVPIVQKQDCPVKFYTLSKWDDPPKSCDLCYIG